MNHLIFDGSYQTLKICMDLDRTFFPFPWTEEDWLDAMEDERYKLFMATTDEQKIVAFSLYQNDAFSGQNHLLKICVDRSLAGRGIARSLFEFAKNYFQGAGFNNCFLEVATTNEVAVSFYLKLGFRVLTEKKSYYSDGSDAYAMQLFY